MCEEEKPFNVHQSAWAQKWVKCVPVEYRVGYTGVPHTCVDRDTLNRGRNEAAGRVNRMTFLAKCATLFCMAMGCFRTQSVRVENICPPWPFGLIRTINASFTILFPDSQAWYMALLRSLFSLFTSPTGVFQCDHADWWPPSQWLTPQRVCVDSFMAHGTLGTFPVTSFLFPLVSCSLSKFELTLLLYLTFSQRECLLSLDFRYRLLVLTVALCPSVGTWHELICAVVCHRPCLPPLAVIAGTSSAQSGA